MPPSTIIRAVGAVLVAAILQGCSGVGSPIALPTAPSPPSNAGARLQASCTATSLLIGQRTICTAVFGSDIGAWTGTTWSVDPPDLVTFEVLGAVSAGQRAGTGTLTATYAGQSVKVPIEVRAEDGLVLSSPTSQSSGTAGSVAMLGLIGYYAVASSERGALSVSVRDATGKTLATAAQPVTRGGGSFGLSVNFTLPSGTPQVCAFATLVVGSTRLELPTDWPDALHCLQIR